MILLLAAGGGQEEPPSVRRIMEGDPILRVTARILAPVILLFGVYVILNGHLGPGGGFAGGAILGGGLISSMIKHGKIDDANEWVQQANHDLRRFSKELRDVTGEGEYIRTGDMVSVLDMFCDNFLTDIMVQSRINGAREQIDSIIGRVQETVRELERKAAGC